MNEIRVLLSLYFVRFMIILCLFITGLVLSLVFLTLCFQKVLGNKKAKKKTHEQQQGKKVERRRRRR